MLKIAVVDKKLAILFCAGQPFPAGCSSFRSQCSVAPIYDRHFHQDKSLEVERCHPPVFEAGRNKHYIFICLVLHK